MGHAYFTPDALKSPSALNITGTANDDRLLALAEAASGAIDRWCNRHFYARRAMKRLDGSGESTIGVPDLVSVDRVRIYGGINGPATLWSASDYDLLPYDADPESAGNPYSRPYTRLLATGARGERHEGGIDSEKRADRHLRISAARERGCAAARDAPLARRARRR